MRTGALALLALLAGPVFSGAEIIERRTELVRLEGPQPPLRGPTADDRFKFPRAGWVSGYTAHVFDERGHPADASGVFCHALFWKRGNAEGEPLAGLGVSVTPLNMSTAEGANSTILPRGYGVAVDSGAYYGFRGMLQSPGHDRDGLYSFGAAFDFIPRGGPHELTTLTVLRVDVSPSAAGDPAAEGWDVPPGRHVYSAVFGVPGDVVAHAINFHLHRFVKSVEVVEVGSDTILYRENVRNRPDGWPLRAPAYSSAAGFPLRAGERYAVRISYDNPLERPEPTMALMRLFVADAKTAN